MNNKKYLERSKKEVRWWSYAAWTTPFSALAGLFFIQMIGWTGFYEKALIIGAIIFFTVSVFWWWWAINKIANFAQIMIDTGKRFEKLKDDIKEFRKDMNDTDNR